MKLRLVKWFPSFRCTCTRCGFTVYTSMDQPMYADLNGKAFVDYYCPDCVDAIINGQPVCN
jgi:hypothetical protein